MFHYILSIFFKCSLNTLQYISNADNLRQCGLSFMVAPQGACLFPLGGMNKLPAQAGKIRSRWLPSALSLYFLPLGDLCATATGLPCDTYFCGPWAQRSLPLPEGFLTAQKDGEREKWRGKGLAKTIKANGPL
jgi:hypothetical protein